MNSASSPEATLRELRNLTITDLKDRDLVGGLLAWIDRHWAEHKYGPAWSEVGAQLQPDLSRALCQQYAGMLLRKLRARNLVQWEQGGKPRTLRTVPGWRVALTQPPEKGRKPVSGQMMPVSATPQFSNSTKAAYENHGST